MPRLLIVAVLFALTAGSGPAAAADAQREIHVPAGWEGAYEFGYAPVIRVGDRVILSGVANGGPGSYEERTRRMYELAGNLLAAAGAGFDDVVEMITFHRASEGTPEFRAEFEVYMPIHKEFFGDHRPAWTAVGTTVLLSAAADVEMRVEAVVGSGASSRVVFENPPGTEDEE